MKRLSRFMFFVIVMWIITFPLPITAQDVLPSHETVVMNYLDLVYRQGAVSAAIPLLTSDAVIHDPVAETYGLTGLVENLTDLHWRVGNLTTTPYTVISEGNIVVVPYVWDATTIADSPYGTPTLVSGNSVEFFRLENGKIAEIWRHSEWHDFSILGTEEDYRTWTYTPTLVETSGIPMLTEMLHSHGLVQTTGTPMLTEMLQSPSLVETTGIPSLVDMAPSFTVPPITLEMLENMPSMVATPSETVVVRWLDSFNQGQINRQLMLPEFKFHTCPCDDGVGTMDLTAFVDNYQTAVADRGFAEWTPLVHGEGFVMASEGGLTALVYDEHFGSPFSHTEDAIIFRVENGLLAEAWQF